MYQEKTGIQSLHAYSETWTQLIRRPSLEDQEVTPNNYLVSANPACSISQDKNMKLDHNFHLSLGLIII